MIALDCLKLKRLCIGRDTVTVCVCVQLVPVAVLVCGLAQAEYSGESTRPTASPYSHESPYRPHYSAEPKSYKEDDPPSHRPYGDARTGPPKKVSNCLTYI